MQIHLTIDEFKILRALAEEGECAGLEISRNLELGFDEFEDLAAALRRRRDQLQAQIKASPESAFLETERSLVEHLLDKVTEACAMI